MANNTATITIQGQSVVVAPQNVSCLICKSNGTYAVCFEDGRNETISYADYLALKALNYNRAGGGIGSTGIISDSIVRMEFSADTKTLKIDGVEFDGGGGTDKVKIYKVVNSKLKNLDGSDITDDKEYVMSHYAVFVIDGTTTYVYTHHDALAPSYGYTFVSFSVDAVGGTIKQYKTLTISDGTSWDDDVSKATHDFQSGGGGSNMVYDASTGNLTGAKDASGNDVTLSTTNITITF